MLCVEVCGVAVVPGGAQLVTACRDRKARLWDLARGEVLRELAHPNDVLCVAVVPGGAQLWTACEDKKARLWDLASGEVLRELAHPSGVLCVTVA